MAAASVNNAAFNGLRRRPVELGLLVLGFDQGLAIDAVCGNVSLTPLPPQLYSELTRLQGERVLTVF